MEEIKESSFAPGMDYNIAYDVSRFLDASITSVLKTLLEAFLLVFVVVYLFLQDLRSTLIPAIAVPVSLIGTFFFMQMLGFSINMLTLFALVLAIGIVVDNAIVVVEAVHVKMHEEKAEVLIRHHVAAIKEIGGAIIAITLGHVGGICAGGLYGRYGRYFLPSVLFDPGCGYCDFGYQCAYAFACTLCLAAPTGRSRTQESYLAPQVLCGVQPPLRPL